ncbi:MAG TPA: sugar transferase [Edaphobacter sp.]|nr:sugar transferase [Edaphobacter sp.]
MRLLVHDFAGYPFPVQLSRELASRGHDVIHAYPIGLQGPKGRLQPSASDPEQLTIRGIALSSGFRKYSIARRFAAHRSYARDIKSLISSRPFDAVLSGNTPIDVQAEILWHCRRSGIRFVHWVQDVYSLAIEFFLRSQFTELAGSLGIPFRMLEKTVCSASDEVIVIAPTFRDRLLRWGVAPSKITVVENWAPLEEMDSMPHANPWADRHGLVGSKVFLYSGTLGLKHRPDLLYALAQSLDATCKVVVITEGIGREYLEKQPKLGNLLLMDFQPYHEMPQVLASADVLLATLAAAAGDFAVPSKVLSYLCAGRPLLLAAPSANLAASVVRRSGGGIVVDPDRTDEWTAAAKLIAADPVLRVSLGSRARQYAETNFKISRTAATFEEVLLRACAAEPLLDIYSLGNKAREVGHEPGLASSQRLFQRSAGLLKRTLDLATSSVLLLLLIPVFATIAIAIKLTSRGPIFFGHRRLGHENQPFQALKFRTMVADAHKILASYLEAHPEKCLEWQRDQKLRNDPRITKVGKWLRRYSLDELPQLLNVLVGQMSMVGPRPIMEAEVLKYGRSYGLYTRVLPGITGLWQVSGRNNTTYEERIHFDEYYVCNWSICLDLYILFRTIRVVLTAEGAY